MEDKHKDFGFFKRIFTLGLVIFQKRQNVNFPEILFQRFKIAHKTHKIQIYRLKKIFLFTEQNPKKWLTLRVTLMC